jgi:hypothetical protein
MAKRTRKTKGGFAAPTMQLPVLGEDAEDTPMGTDQTATMVWKNWKASRKHLEKWHTEAKESYDFVSGRQWDQGDIDILTEQQRPVITFNRTGTTVDAVAGYEINGRQDVTFLPRTTEDSGPAEVESDAARYFRGECDAEDEESDSFHDVLVCGLGWVSHSMDYDQNPEGMMLVERVDPMEMGYDPAAIKRNLVDRRWDIRGKWMDREAARLKWPDADWQTIPLEGATEDEVDHKSPINVPENAFYRSGSSEGYDQQRNKVFILEQTWFVLEPFYSVSDPATGKLIEVEPDAHKRIQQAAKADGIQIKSVKRTKRAYKRAFVCGNTTLEEGEAPCPDMFHYQAMTGKRDRNQNVWFGLVRAMKDPQRWANKFLSQYLHMINANVKGGIDYEEGAFADISEVEKNQSKPGATLKIEAGFFDKVRRTSPTQIPNNVFQLMEFSVTSLRDVTGVNVELLGTADRNQPGVLENQRKQSAMAILAPIFDSQRRYRKMAGRLEMYFIGEFLSDGRLIRISGEDNAKFVPLTKKKGFEEYDIIVDQAPTAPNQKEAAFGVIMQVLPATMKMGVPTPPEVLDYIPGLPQKLVEAWKKLLTAPPDPKKSVMEILEGLKRMAEIEKDATAAEKNKADALVATGGMQISALDTIGQLMIALQQASQPATGDQPAPVSPPPGGMPPPAPMQMPPQLPPQLPPPETVQ